MRPYYTLPSIPDAGLLTRYMDTLGVVVPLARTNLVINPSGETNTTGYTAVGGGASINQTFGTNHWGGSSSFFGVYGILANIGFGGASDGLYYGTVSLTSGVIYAYSCMFVGDPGGRYKISVATTAGADLSVTRFTGAGVWQWVYGIHTETSTTTRRIYVTRDNDAAGAASGAGSFIVDGLQVESCADGYYVPTTYIDGDQKGLVANQYPPAYGWNGTPHASTSYRIGQTRAGGQVLYWKRLGFYLTTIIGLGLAPPAHQALTFAQLDGGQYLDTLKPPRQFTMAGRWGGMTPNELDASISQLGRVLDRDLVGGQRQPLVLTMQAQECGVPCGQPVRLQALYSGGMEGQVQDLPTATQPVTFENYLPLIVGPDQGVPLNVQNSLTPNAILHRSPSGAWDTLGTGVTGGTQQVNAFVRGLDGLIYLGGSFTDAGGSGADYFAAYNPVTGTYSAPGGAGSFNGSVNALAVGPDGKIYIGGAFTNAGSIANADGIVVWDGAAFAALSTGTAGTIYALAFSPSGTLYAGGSFTSIGASGADNVASWNGSAWSNLTSDAAIGAQVNALAWGNNQLYVGGKFDNAGGVAAADRIAAWTSSGGWVALSTGMNNDVNAIAVGLDGVVYAGGTFTTAGGVSALRIAQWNGQQWAPMGAGLNNSVTGLAVSPDASLYVIGLFTTTGSIDLGGVYARWNGNWMPGEVVLSVNTGISGLYIAPDGNVYLGFVAGGTATVPGVQTASNVGTAAVYPRLIINGPSSGTSRIYQIVDATTGKGIYFNLTLSAGEMAILTFDPQNISFLSSFQGNILGAITPGSLSTLFALQPGNNSISFFATSSTVTASLSWPVGYVSLNDAIQRAVP